MDKEVKEKKVCRQQVVFCVLVVLYVFVSLLFSLPVHAATVTPKGSLILESSSGDYLSTAYTSYVRIYSEDSPPLKFASLVRYDDIDKGDSATLDFIMYTTDIDASFTFYSGSETQYTDTSKSPYTSYMKFSSSGMTIYTLSDGTKVRASAGGLGMKCYTITPYVPMYNGAPGYKSLTSKEYIQAFLEHLLITGDLVPNNGGSIDNPDFEDTAYAFTGFTANNKMTASWTGTTERSYLQDQKVEEYVRVNYYFADKEAQDTIKQADAYPDEFATADKTLTIDVSGLNPDDENWFLRYIRITPCYRQAGLGAWGDFYHGEPSYVYFNQDGSIDRIDAPYIKGELSIDMERPVIVLHEAANGNPTESDFSYFEFNNAQSDYFFEMKGRWYTTNDFDLYRDKLVWKYKYSTLLKNNLSTWVSVSDNRSSVGRFQFDVLGKSSWDNLLSSYPVDDRNYIGGSYNLFNKITGYSDALETLKMLLKQPYSLFNGYEVYVRYFRYDENGGIQYSKWTHFYNNLADSDGSSGSRLDDLDNMYSENQSDKGLTDDELSDLENGGNSRNDLDAVPKNNYDYSSLENATMNFFDLLKNFGTMLGQFPSMVAAVFGFLPPWLIGLIAVAIGAVIVCRFIGR